MRRKMSLARRIVLALGLIAVSRAQTVQLQTAHSADFPALVDSNSPAYWSGTLQYLFNSLDLPIRSESTDGAHFARSRAVSVQGTNNWRWIESAWVDTDGTVYAWYHAEPTNVCPGLPLTAPQIGALISTDGVFFQDLGIVLSSGDPPDCSTHNFYFAGGTGDFSVIPDRDGGYFYFLFTNYGGPAQSQGIGIARMAFADRAQPAGRVFKLSGNNWTEPGLGGTVTPIFPAKASWNLDNPDSFWGPAVHWNNVLQQYVVLMNHAIDSVWSQEGIYISFNPNLADPSGWTAPAKLLDGGAGWYPQVLGSGSGESDTMIAGSSARLYVMGHSEWTINFAAGPLQVQTGVLAPVPPTRTPRPTARPGRFARLGATAAGR
jgi:hypothetical protein